MQFIAPIPDEERRLMRKEAQQIRDKNHARRLITILMLHQGMNHYRCRQNALCCPLICRQMDKVVYFTWQ